MFYCNPEQAINLQRNFDDRVSYPLRHENGNNSHLQARLTGSFRRTTISGLPNLDVPYSIPSFSLLLQSDWRYQSLCQQYYSTSY